MSKAKKRGRFNRGLWLDNSKKNRGRDGLVSRKRVNAIRNDLPALETFKKLILVLLKKH